MEVDIDAVYIRDSDINIRGNTLISLWYAAHKLYPGEIHGAQLVNGFWSIYTRSNKTRTALITSGVIIDGATIKVYDDKPIRDIGKKTERVVIKDLPATTPPDRILAFLKGFPHVTTRSRVMYAKERLGGEELSPFINGDRIVYVSAAVSPPLPKETVICGHLCRIWHPSQKNFCKRCASHGHRTIDTDVCDSYEPDCLVSAWRGDNNPLSNFYKCTLSDGDFTYKSAEHFYQHEFCTFMNNQDVAKLVIDSPTPREAKQIASQLKVSENSEQLAEWYKINISMMNYILRVKWNSCAKFRQALLSTEGMVVAEATSCDFWGVGVAPNLAQHTKATKFLGQNHMGKLQMALRCHVTQPGMLNDEDQLTLPIKPVYPADSTEASVLAILESLTMSPALVSQGQGDTAKNQAGVPVSISTDALNAMDTTTHDDVKVVSDVISDNSTPDPVCNSTPIADDMISRVPDSQPVSSTNGHTASQPVPSTSGHTESQLVPSMSGHTESQPVPSTSGHTESQPVPSMSGHTTFQPVHFASGPASAPKVPPRRKRTPKTKQSSASVTVKSYVNTLDNFVHKESPSCKRKLSDGSSGSPSSAQLTKTTRTDGADTIS